MTSIRYKVVVERYLTSARTYVVDALSEASAGRKAREEDAEVDLPVGTWVALRIQTKSIEALDPFSTGVIDSIGDMGFKT